MNFILWLCAVLSLLLSCGAAPVSHQHHHGTERGNAILHPADHACGNSELKHGDFVEITEGMFKGFHAKVLEKTPSGRYHCHVLIAFPDPHIDVLSVIGVLEIDLLRKVDT